MDMSLIITISAAIVIPFIGWLWNSIITKKFNDLDEKTDKVQDHIEKHVDIIFRRLDENKASYYEAFVLKEIHAEMMRHAKEMSEQQNSTVEGLIRELAQEIRSLRALIRLEKGGSL